MLLNVQTDIKKINDAADSLISAVRSRVGLTNEDEYKVRLIVKELLTNVLSYSDADKVTLGARLEDSTLIIEIEDNGSGFKYQDIMNRDVTGDDFLMCDGGRGIFLVRMMAESISYNEKGNRVKVAVGVGGY